MQNNQINSQTNQGFENNPNKNIPEIKQKKEYTGKIPSIRKSFKNNSAEQKYSTPNNQEPLVQIVNDSEFSSPRKPESSSTFIHGDDDEVVLRGVRKRNVTQTNFQTLLEVQNENISSENTSVIQINSMMNSVEPIPADQPIHSHEKQNFFLNESIQNEEKKMDFSRTANGKQNQHERFENSLEKNQANSSPQKLIKSGERKSQTPKVTSATKQNQSIQNNLNLENQNNQNADFQGTNKDRSQSLRESKKGGVSDIQTNQQVQVLYDHGQMTPVFLKMKTDKQNSKQNQQKKLINQNKTFDSQINTSNLISNGNQDESAELRQSNLNQPGMKKQKSQNLNFYDDEFYAEVRHELIDDIEDEGGRVTNERELRDQPDRSISSEDEQPDGSVNQGTPEHRNYSKSCVDFLNQTKNNSQVTPNKPLPQVQAAIGQKTNRRATVQQQRKKKGTNEFNQEDMISNTDSFQNAILSGLQKQKSQITSGVDLDERRRQTVKISRQSNDNSVNIGLPGHKRMLSARNMNKETETEQEIKKTNDKLKNRPQQTERRWTQPIAKIQASNFAQTRNSFKKSTIEEDGKKKQSIDKSTTPQIQNKIQSARASIAPRDPQAKKSSNILQVKPIQVSRNETESNSALPRMGDLSYSVVSDTESKMRDFDMKETFIDGNETANMQSKALRIQRTSSAEQSQLERRQLEQAFVLPRATTALNFHPDFLDSRSDSNNFNRIEGISAIADENLFFDGKKLGEQSESSNNIKVVIRVRPFNQRENDDIQKRSCVDISNNGTMIQLDSNNGDRKTFNFDFVGHEGIDQKTIFNYIAKPIADSCLQGYNGTIFAYGQTGAGKTFTIQGPCIGPSQSDQESQSDHQQFLMAVDGESQNLNGLDEKRGIMQRSFEYIFQCIEAEKAAVQNKQNGAALEFLVKVSFLEIYNEHIRDLLTQNDKRRFIGNTADIGEQRVPDLVTLNIREDINKGVYVEGLHEEVVVCHQDMLTLIYQGTKNRAVGATSMNKQSSRSHSVLTTIIESKSRSATGVWNVKTSRFHIIDLAGSERQKVAGTGGDRLKEAGAINKSLSALGNVINSLVDVSEGRNRHVPYRDSKLTFILRDSLGGNSKTAIIANISPSHLNINETLSTLKFAQRAKLIRNKAVINEDSSGTIILLKNEIKKLKRELGDCMRNITSLQIDKQALAQNVALNARLQHDLEIQKQQSQEIRDKDGALLCSKCLKQVNQVSVNEINAQEEADINCDGGLDKNYQLIDFCVYSQKTESADNITDVKDQNYLVLGTKKGRSSDPNAFNSDSNNAIHLNSGLRSKTRLSSLSGNQIGALIGSPRDAQITSKQMSFGSTNELNQTKRKLQAMHDRIISAERVLQQKLLSYTGNQEIIKCLKEQNELLTQSNNLYEQENIKLRIILGTQKQEAKGQNDNDVISSYKQEIDYLKDVIRKQIENDKTPKIIALQAEISHLKIFRDQALNALAPPGFGNSNQGQKISFIEQLQAQLEMQSQTINSMQAHFQTSTTGLSSEIQNFENQIVQLQQEIQNQIKTKQIADQNSQSQISQLQGQLEEAQAQLDSETIKLQKQLQELERTNARLKVELAEQNQQNIQVQTVLNKLTKKIQESEKEVKMLRLRDDESNILINEKQKIIEGNKEEIENLKQQNEQLQYFKNQFEKQNKELKGKLESWFSEIQTKNEENLKHLRKQSTEKQEELDQIKPVLVESQNEVQQLNQRIIYLIEQVKQLTLAGSNLGDKTQYLEEQKAALEEENQNHQQQIEQLTKENLQNNNKMKELLDHMAANAEEMDKIVSQNDEYKKKIQFLVQELTNLQSKQQQTLGDIEKQNQQKLEEKSLLYEQNMIEIQILKDKHETEITKFKELLNQKQQQISENEQQLQTLTSEKNNLLIVIKKFEQDVEQNKKNQEIEIIQMRLENTNKQKLLEQNLEKFSIEVTVLQKQIIKEQQNKMEMDAKFEELEKQLNLINQKSIKDQDLISKEQEKIELLLNQKQDLEKKISKMQEKEQETEEHLQVLKIKEKEVVEIKTELENRNSFIEIVQNKLSDTEAQLQSELDKSINQVQNLEQQIKSFQQQLKEYEELIIEKEQFGGKIIKQNINLQDTNQQLKQQVSELTTQIQGLQEELKKNQEENEQQIIKLAEQSRQIVQQLEQIKEKEEELVEKRKSLNMLEDMVIKQSVIVNKYENNTKEQTDLCRDLKLEIADLLDQLSKSEQIRNKISKELQEKVQEIEQVKNDTIAFTISQKNQFNDEISKLKDQLIQEGIKIQQLSQKISEEDSEKQGWINKNQDKASEIERLQVVIKGLTECINSKDQEFQDSIKDLQDNLKNQNKQIADAKELERMLREEIEGAEMKYKQKNLKREAKLASLEKEVDQLNSQLLAIRTQCSSQKEGISKRDQEISSLTNRTNQLEQANENYKQEIAQVTALITQVKEQRDDFKNQLQKLQDEHKILVVSQAEKQNQYLEEIKSAQNQSKMASQKTLNLESQLDRIRNCQIKKFETFKKSAENKLKENIGELILDFQKLDEQINSLEDHSNNKENSGSFISNLDHKTSAEMRNYVQLANKVNIESTLLLQEVFKKFEQQQNEQNLKLKKLKQQLDNSHEKYGENERKLIQLEKEIKQYKDSVDEKEQTIIQLKKENDKDRKEQLGYWREKIKFKEAQIQKVETQRDEFEQKLKDKDKELDKLKSKVNEVGGKREKHEILLAKEQQLRQEIQTELENYKVYLPEAEKLLLEVNKRHQVAQKELESIKRQMQLQQETINLMEQDHQNQIQIYQNELEHYKLPDKESEELSILKKEVEQLNETRKALESTLKEREQEMRQLVKALKVFRKEKDEAIRERQKMKEQMDLFEKGQNPNYRIQMHLKLKEEINELNRQLNIKDQILRSNNIKQS